MLLQPLLLDIEWHRDAAGYRVRPAERGRSRPATNATDRRDAHPIHERIVRKGGELLAHRPFDANGGLLHRIFAVRARTKEGLLDFINDFGPLTAAGNDEGGEEVGYGLDVAVQMNEWLCRSPEDRAARLSALGAKGFDLSDASMALACDPVTGQPRLRCRAMSLERAMWLEFANSFAGDTVKRCAHCGLWFRAGAGMERRQDAIFCSHDHKLDFNSLRRSKGRIKDA
jgi:hypothetical protein